jgi:hypothetical protein
MGPRPSLAAALVAVLLAGCGGGGGSGYGCTGNTCTATFDGTGSQDLRSDLGDDAEIDVRDISGDTVNIAAAGTEHNLKVGETQDFGPLKITLKAADGESATVRVVKSA